MFLRARKHEKVKILNSITSTDGWDEYFFRNWVIDAISALVIIINVYHIVCILSREDTHVSVGTGAN